MGSFEDYRKIMKREFERRIKRNRSYSLRAYARDLGLSSSRLSEIFSGKQGLSRARGEKVARGLGLKRDRIHWFCDLVEARDGRSNMSREMAKMRLLEFENRLRTHETSARPEDQIDWYFFVIRRLTQVEGFKSDPAWIAQQLGIDKARVERLIVTMLQYEMIKRDDSGNLSITENWANKIDSAAAKRVAQAQFRDVLDLGYQAYLNMPSAFRRQAVHFFAVNMKKVQKVFELINNLDDDLDDLTYELEPGQVVYCMTAQAFPMHSREAMEQYLTPPLPKGKNSSS